MPLPNGLGRLERSCTGHLAKFGQQNFQDKRWRVLATDETTLPAQGESAKTTTTEQVQDPSEWQSFAKSASGEWDGVSASFDRDGEPQQLPDYYVPEAYRDWGVKLYDWQTQCSMKTTETGGLQYKLRRLMPTVGCEADAIAFTEEADVIFPLSSGGTSEDGSYCLAPVDLTSGSVQKSSVEYCFALNDNKRVRVVQILKRMGSDQRWQLSTIEVHSERYDGEYNGRRELAGCGGGMDPFAIESPKAECSEIMDPAWRCTGSRLILNPGGDVPSKELITNEPLVVDIQKVVCLPLKVWSYADISADGSAHCKCAAGILLEDGHMLLGRVIFKEWELRETELLYAQR